MKNITMGLFCILLFFASCKSNSQQIKSDAQKQPTEVKKKEIDTESNVEDFFELPNGEIIEKIVKSPEDWKKSLSAQEYYVLREKGTERSFTSDLLTNKVDGTYNCGACNFPLFASSTKFKSGTGWPSFYQPIDNERILESTDYDLGYGRTEVMCRKCEGHLGHVFKDGPEPTGLRYCINGVSLAFEKE